jgi:3-methyladenine DNA glycosylase/8-oxoguanine DNA glycosylase
LIKYINNIVRQYLMGELQTSIDDYKKLLDSEHETAIEHNLPFRQIGRKIAKCSLALIEKHKNELIARDDRTVINALHNIYEDARKLQSKTPTASWFFVESLTCEEGWNIYKHMMEQLSIAEKALNAEL